MIFINFVIGALLCFSIISLQVRALVSKATILNYARVRANVLQPNRAASDQVSALDAVEHKMGEFKLKLF
jgi:hypothetical protein